MTTAPTTTKKAYHISCVKADGDAIQDMKEKATEITRETFMRHVSPASRKTLEEELGYTNDFKIANDWGVSYHRSVYLGHPCVYLRWSGIEYVFT